MRERTHTQARQHRRDDKMYECGPTAKGGATGISHWGNTSVDGSLFPVSRWKNYISISGNEIRIAADGSKRALPDAVSLEFEFQ